MARVLLVDDDPGVLFTLEEALEGRGHLVSTARSGDEARLVLADIDVLVTDLVMPGLDGMGLLALARQVDPLLPVLLLTARGSERLAVAAMKAGAFDYLPKPFSIEELRISVDRAAELGALRRGATRHSIERAVGRPLIGESASFRRLLQVIEQVADREVPVLVQGESGTGKELVATALHARSRRAGAPCVRFNCAAIPAELAEAELFGHVRGAFTGAVNARRGYLAAADRGTLVLDEIGELPLSVQPKLLRALQDGEIQVVGAARTEKVDVRVVACTHRDLRVEVERGTFRQDLYYRLAVLEVLVPPLRERREDIPILADAFRLGLIERFGSEPVTFSAALVSELSSRQWPGNVRELENVVARLLAHATAPVLDLAALVERPDLAPASIGTTGPALLRDRVMAFERLAILETLSQTSQNQSEAARRLGMTRVGLIEKMKRLGIPRGRASGG